MTCLVKYIEGKHKGRMVVMSYHTAQKLEQAKVIEIIKLYDNVTVTK